MAYKNFYLSLTEAQQATVRLGIRSYSMYKRRYKEDPRLPCCPDKEYKREWPTNGWYSFLGKKIKKSYGTLAEAKKAVSLLNITSSADYRKRYKEDPLLPSSPEVTYHKEWTTIKGWNDFLGKKVKIFYSTFSEAQQAVILLGINSLAEYKKRHNEDPKLPSNPNIFYSNEWSPTFGWDNFLMKGVKDYYPLLSEARKAVGFLNIKSIKEYKKRYAEDSRLPPHPNTYYLKEWVHKKGWKHFLRKKELYLTYIEAQQAAISLGIISYSDYMKRHKKDTRLPYSPALSYPKEWEPQSGWDKFLLVKAKTFYPSFYEAQQASVLLGIKSSSDYEKRYKEDLRLPSSPKVFYSNEWPLKYGWDIFLQRKNKIPYKTLTDFNKAILLLGISSQREYLLRYKEDPKLPANPEKTYYNEWVSINKKGTFWGVNNYSTLLEAKKATIDLGITSRGEYLRRYKKDPKLPSSPNIAYSDDWSKLSSPVEFYTPDTINTFSLLVQAVKALNINNSTQYRKLSKKYNQLPSNPKRSFPSEFIDWYHLCDIPKPYEYSKLHRLVKTNKITTIEGYKLWRRASKDPKIPSSPHEHSYYKSDWVNWYVFFGVEEPFQPKYIHEPYLAWRNEISVFMKFARGGGSKKTLLCKFIRLYVQKYQLGKTPLDFVLNKAISIIKFRDFVAEVGQQYKIHYAVDEFIDFIIRTKCSDEDPETGEVTRMLDAKNRLEGSCLNEKTSHYSPDETQKPALSFQYVQALRKWTIPPEAKTFSDLDHLQKFSADWITVPLKNIDKDDPDCVFKIINSEFAKIWVPIYWIHTYTLISVPLRGMQIAYNDSGEADAYLPEYDNGKIIWVKNKSKLAGLTKDQGMIKRYPHDEFGMFSTSNKTSLHSGSQSVPWMPIELAFWLIKLRKWQSKYNSIQAPKAWLDCERTNLNEIQSKQKSVNCFLFRDFGRDECGTFTNRLTNRIAVALYYSQPKGGKLAVCEGPHIAISKYKSKYTPHCMRVSLITIYVMEYNLDLSIIMKISGHSSIVMSIYYVRANTAALSKKIEEGEKIALKNQVSATQSMIEQLRIDEIKPNLVSNSEETLKALSNITPAGNYLFRDWGICPHAGTRCEDGGKIIGNTQTRSPVPIGYLGGENCVRCRHFITGPAFIGGLLAIFQEIILYLEAKQLHYDELIEDENELLSSLEKEDEKEYICNKNNEKHDLTKRKDIEANIRKTKSEYEVVVKKMDMLYCDLGAVSTLVHQCQALLNQSNLSIDNDGSNLQLIVRPEHELQVITEEVSQYELLCVVCENAEIYQSASAELAITPRTQLIDNMMLRNNLKPLLFTLTNKQQLKAGNQLNKLFKERLKSHVKVNDLIEGKLLLSDLEEHERIEPVDLLNVLHQQRIDIKEI
jgi:hypothetical protein